MSVYYPDRWVIVEFISPKFGTVRKILVSSYGGYGGSDSWKLSSAIVSTKPSNGSHQVNTKSGSVYNVHDTNYGLSGYSSGVLENWRVEAKNEPSITINLMDESVAIALLDSLVV